MKKKKTTFGTSKIQNSQFSNGLDEIGRKDSQNVKIVIIIILNVNFEFDTTFGAYNCIRYDRILCVFFFILLHSIALHSKKHFFILHIRTNFLHTILILFWQFYTFYMILALCCCLFILSMFSFIFIPTYFFFLFSFALLVVARARQILFVSLLEC